jgi:transcriptional regulator with XRE-family HTH domain
VEKVKFLIKKLREERGLTQKELSVKSGISRNLIARLESGDIQNTTTDTLFKIANALGVKAENLFFEDNV